MIELDVIREGTPIEFVLTGLAGQLPFAYATTINNTLNDAQAAVRGALPREFTLRRADFINRTIYIGPQDRARKDRLSGTVRVNPERNFLAKFEDGGAKQSTSGRSLAVPIIRANDRGLVIRAGDPLNIKKLMDAIAQRGGRLKQRRKKGAPPPGPLGEVFLMQTPTGTLVLQRPVDGPDRVGNRSNLKVLYKFEKQVPIKELLHFDEIAMAAALAHWDENFHEALDRAIATAR